MNDKKLYGLIGRNIQYSVSPVMHNAAFNHFGIPAEYKLFDIEEKDFDPFWEENIAGGTLSAIQSLGYGYRRSVSSVNLGR